MHRLDLFTVQQDKRSYQLVLTEERMKKGEIIYG